MPSLHRCCAHCRHFAAWTAHGTAALCSRRHGPRVRAQPEDGCCAWEREPGADDEPIAPPSRVDIRLSWQLPVH